MVTAPTQAVIAVDPLVRDIRVSVRHYIKTSWPQNQKPDYSGKELLAIALLYSNQPLTFGEILTKLMGIFAYYKVAANAMLVNHVVDSNHRTPGAGDVLTALASSLREPLDSFEFPVNCHENGTELRWSMSAMNAVRVLYLMDKLFPAGSDILSPELFNKLPAELKEQIYEYAFTYPLSGLQISSANALSNRPGTAFRLQSRSYSAAFSTSLPMAPNTSIGQMSIAGRPYGPSCTTAPLREILNPLGASSTFYNEGIGYFYECNTFHFPDVPTLHKMLHGMPSHRRKHLRRLTFNYSGNEIEAASAFGMLVGVEKLQSLAITINMTAYRTGKGGWRRSVFNMSGLSQLRSIRGLQHVQVTGSPELEAVLKVEMMLGHGEEGLDLGKGKKRKAKAVGADDQGAIVKKQKTGGI